MNEGCDNHERAEDGLIPHLISIKQEKVYLRQKAKKKLSNYLERLTIGRISIKKVERL